MVETKPIFEQDSPLIPLGGFLFFGGAIGTIGALILLLIGGAKVWMLSLPLASVLGLLLMLPFVTAHAKYAMGIGGGQTEETNDGEQAEENEEKEQ